MIDVTMNEKTLVIAICLAAVITGCRSVPSQRLQSGISVTLHPITYSPLISSVTNAWFITDVSQRDPVPDGAFVGPRGVSFPDGVTPELVKWKEKYATQVDLIVEIKNISDQELSLYEEWNSWGYCNLKFVFGDGCHEYWVTKQPGVWYRNFASFHTLVPSESIQIPVAFADHIWSNLDQIRTNATDISAVRAVYEQCNVFFSPSEGFWHGSQSSRYYPASDLLPRFGFRKAERMPDEQMEWDAVEPPPVDWSEPDDIKIKGEEIL
jgi:hypothetical protein